MAPGRNIEVRILGDAYQLEAALGRAGKLLAQFGGDATLAADAQVKAGVRSREDLKKLAVAYQQAADAAVKGSDEQIIAARKAAEANGQLARLNQGYAAKNIRSAEESGAAWSKASSGMFAFAKQALFFGAGYLGFVGLKKSLDAVLAAQTSIGQRNQAIKNAHADLGDLLPILQRYEELGRKRGFTDDETRQAEAKLITAFGATKHSLGELVVAENLARTSKQDLGTATKGLILLQEGNTRAAKQYGLALPDLAKKVWEEKAAHDGLTISQEKGKVLYDELTQRIKGQADAFAHTPEGKLKEFQSELNKIEVTIGKDLLPTVTKYLTLVDDWLSKSSNQKRITDDVKTAIHDLSTGLHDAYDAGKQFLDAVDPIVHMLGGWKTVLEAIIGLKFASAVSGWISPIQKLIGSEAAAGATSGAGLSGASGLSGKLLGNLKGLAKMGALTLGLDMIIKSTGDKGAKGFLESLFGAGLVGFTFGGPEGALAAVGIDLVIHAYTDKMPNGGLETGITDGNPHHHVLGNAASSGLSGGPGKGSSRPIDIFYDDRKKAFFVGFNDGSTEPISAAQAAHDLHISVAQLYQAAGISAHGKGSGGGGGAAEGHRIVQAGKKYGGTGGGTYQLGGGHTSGQVKFGSALDCSGFIYQSLLRAGVKGFSYGSAASQFAALQRGAGGNWSATDVGVDGAKPGDLVYWDNLTREPQPGHAGIVVSGSGSGARVMAYENSHDGSGVQGIGIYPVRGVFRMTIVKGRPDSPYGPPTPSAGGSGGSSTSTPSKPKVPAAITGSNLISEGLRNLIANAANHATTAHGLVAVRWLKTELGDLEEARRQLEEKLKHSTGKQRAAIQAELRSVDGEIARVQKAVSSAVASWARSELSKIESKADSAFNKATQAHIQNVIAPQFFQGNDAHGNRRLTPAEAALQAMQQADQQKSLQDALTQAQAQLVADQAAGANAATLATDQQAVDAAQRQITEDELATKATAERAKADADYAKAVKKYEAERAQREKALNAALVKFTENLAKGAAVIGGLAKVLEHYGLPGNTVHLPGTGPKRVHVHHHHPKHPHATHSVHTGDSIGAAGKRPIHVVIELDGRKLASALVPRSDQVVRVKLS